MKKILPVITIFLFALSVFVLSGCNRGEGENPNTDDVENEFVITVKTDTGKTFSGITVEFLDKNGRFLDYKATDANGVVTSKKLTENEIVIKLYEVPEGYKVKESYNITEDRKEILLETTLRENTSLANETYKLGSVMRDFTLADKNGTEYTLSALLQEKKAVVLNFWYNTCHFCMQEFPEMNTVYNELNDSLEILAINSVDKTFASETDSLSFPLIRDLIGIENAFARGYGAWSNPATVIIDRYGVVSFLHVGALNEEQLTKLLEFYTAQNYVHSEYETYSDFNAVN